MDYPQTTKITIDDWSIIPEGLMKGVYHTCTGDFSLSTFSSSWRVRVVFNDKWECPNCKKTLPKDIDAIASTLKVIN